MPFTDFNSPPKKVPLGAYRVTAIVIEKDGAKHAMKCSRVVGVEGEDEDRRLSVTFPGRGTKKFVERYAQLTHM